jgi:hypothetical protein
MKKPDKLKFLKPKKLKKAQNLKLNRQTDRKSNNLNPVLNEFVTT